MSYDEDFSMKVHSGQVGRIIGRGGNKIRELQQDSGAKISVAREEDREGKKSVDISGSRDQIERARELIDDCLNSDFGGRGGGYGSRGSGGGGGGSGGYRSRNSGGGSGWGRRDNGDRYDRDYGSRQQSFNDDGPRETIYVDSSEVGRIIGRGGSRIRDMENDSGCRIKVSRDNRSGGRNSVDLIGSSDQIHKAKQLILEAGVEIGDDRGRGW